MNDKSKSYHQDNLATVFVFTDEDLAANREGKLSLRQRTLMRAELHSGATRHLPGAFFFLILGGLMVLSSYVGREHGLDLAIILLPLGAGFSFILLATIVIISTGKIMRKLWLDVRGDVVKIREGSVNLVIESRKLFLTPNPAQPGLHIEGEHFEINEYRSMVFRQGDLYRVYFLPHMNVIISAVWLSSDPFEQNENSKISHQDNLATIFNFTDEDLAANREGKLSLRQRTLMRAELLSEAKNNLPGNIFLLLGGIFISVYRSDEVTVGILIGGPCILLAVGLIISTGKTLYKQWQDLSGGMVKIGESPVRLTIEPGKSVLIQSSDQPVVYIEEERLEISGYGLLAFRDGDLYRVYYLPHSRIIISVEWLNANPFEV